MKNVIKTVSEIQDLVLNGSGEEFSPRVCRASLPDEAGQSLMEFALTMPLFILILLGAATFARIAWDSIEVTSAARAGVQYASQSSTFASDTAGIAAAVGNDGTNLRGLAVKSTAISCACVTTGSSAAITCSSALTSCPAPSTIVEYVQVTTSATVTPLFHCCGVPSTVNLQGQAQMEVEQ